MSEEMKRELSGLKSDVGGLKKDVVGLKSDVGGLKKDVVGLKSDVGGLKKDVVGLKSDVGGLKKDVSGLKSDVGGLKKDVVGLKSDVGGLKKDVGGLRGDVGNLTTLARNTSMALSRLIGDIADMKRDLVTKDDFSTLMKRMDGFADMLQDSRWDWGKQKIRLDEHEQRIAALEARRA